MNSKTTQDKFTHFLKSEDETISFLRDIVVAVTVVLVILTALWGYTGQWFGAPMVAIESGSMMHLDEPFGRIGTIDAGDMVLLDKVDIYDDIIRMVIMVMWLFIESMVVLMKIKSFIEQCVGWNIMKMKPTLLNRIIYSM